MIKVKELKVWNFVHTPREETSMLLGEGFFPSSAVDSTQSQKYFFFSYSYSFDFYFYLITPANVLSTKLKKSMDSGQFCLIPDFHGVAFLFI